MPRKSYTIEQIIGKLRESEVLLSQGQTVGDSCRSFNICEQTHLTAGDEYTWECLAIRVERNLDHENVQEFLAEHLLHPRSSRPSPFR